jgi:hypothetical protein
VGAIGATGATGPTGPAGTGITGAQGPAGVNVPSIVSTTVPPEALTLIVAANGGDGCERAGDEIAGFLDRVVAWPDTDDAAGYVNLHWTMLHDDGKLIWTGKPCRCVDDFMQLTRWALTRPSTRDIYFCLSLQRCCRQNSKGKLAVMRSQQNAIVLKAIWLDIDVKEPPKGYATIQEALAALKEFYKAVGLPKPSALISSGGGLHVYWISKTALTPDEWRPLARGLKNAALKRGLRCDAGCTIDSARILRVPGTWNCKTEPRRPVQLLWLGEDYDF